MFRAPRVLKTQATAPPVGAAVSSSGKGALITCSMVKVGCCGASGAGGRRASEIEATRRRGVVMGQEATPDSSVSPGGGPCPKSRAPPSREPRARARGQLKHSRAPRVTGDQGRVALELIGDVPRRAREIALVNRGHEVTPGPADGAGDPPIGAGCSHRFREAHAIAQPDVRSKADDGMHMICQHSVPQYPYAGGFELARYGTPYIYHSGRIDTPTSLPGVPRHVSVHLIGVMTGHRG